LYFLFIVLLFHVCVFFVSLSCADVECTTHTMLILNGSLRVTVMSKTSITTSR